MSIFSYRAINDDGKEVHGSIESADLGAAKAALLDLHLDVVDVQEATRTSGSAQDVSEAPPLITYAFEGTDAGGKTRRGTVQAANKKAAFHALRTDQKLILTMLAPMGTLPKYNDHELIDWQKADTPVVKTPVAEPKKLQFTPTPELVPPKKSSLSTEPAPTSKEYHSLLTTITLYAGWLLAWYGLFVSFGYYATARILPWDIPFVQAFYVSPLIFSFTVGIYLLLLAAALHRFLRGRWITGILLTLVSCAVFLWIRMML